MIVCIHGQPEPCCEICGTPKVAPVVSSEALRFHRYSAAHERTQTARAEWEAASTRLDLAHIRERAAECASQRVDSLQHGELLKAFPDITDREREIALAFTRYVVYGRAGE